jgi:hypothetical protein
VGVALVDYESGRTRGSQGGGALLDLFLYFVLDRLRSNLAPARRELRRVEQLVDA